MGGPFRAIVGGQASYRWSFPPAQALRINNYSDQYGHLVDIDEYVTPGQIGLVVPLENPLAGITFIFEKPPGASQAAPTSGQVCLVTSYDVAEVGVSVPPLGPDPGLLLPIGLDSPQHFHQHNHGAHLHGHSATHVHGSATHLHGHSATHVHGLSTAGVANTGASDGTVGLHTHTYLSNVGGSTDAAAPGNTDNATPGNTGASAPGNTDNATPATDTTLENVQHTHP